MLLLGSKRAIRMADTMEWQFVKFLQAQRLGGGDEMRRAISYVCFAAILCIARADIREHHHSLDVEDLTGDTPDVDDLTGDTPDGAFVEPVTGQQEALRTYYLEHPLPNHAYWNQQF
eukprot:Skav209276  [mRNA]  locus=scaffold1552:339991:341066:+ [translate_table: standard]